MNKITQLFDQNYVNNFFTKKILPLYSDFKKIKKIKIIPHKKNVWEHTYHVVLEFDTTFIDRSGHNKNLSIFCSAHSDEPRKNVYTVLKFLWENGFAKGYATIPRPLFYSNYFRATFYRGVKGNHLYHYIRKKDFNTIEEILPKAAKWFAKLHKVKTKNGKNFNKTNSRIKTVFPGVNHVLERIQHQYPEYAVIYKKLYEHFILNEQEFFKTTEERWLVHGDAHPENIIKMGKKKIAVIDFTDLCLADYTRDLGTFLQQIHFMCQRKDYSQTRISKYKNIFLDSYFQNSESIINKKVRKRINNYYNYTAIRTATFFLIKHHCEPERAKPLIKKVCQDLNMC